MFLQNQTESFWHWLYTNAPAAWISAFIAVGSLLLVLRTRKKPKRIVIREVSRSSLIRIWPGVRQKIQITFGGNRINTLGQVDLEIFNEGSEFIEHPEFVLILPTQTSILDSHAIPEDAKAECRIERNKIWIRLPHLNPYREHRQIVSVSVLVDGRTAPLKTSGGGEGWSVRHCPLPSPGKRFWLENAGPFAFILFAILGSLYLHWTLPRLGISEWEVSWRSLYASLPAIVPMLFILTLQVWKIRRLLRRPKTGWVEN